MRIVPLPSKVTYDITHRARAHFVLTPQPTTPAPEDKGPKRPNDDKMFSQRSFRPVDDDLPLPRSIAPDHTSPFEVEDEFDSTDPRFSGRSRTGSIFGEVEQSGETNTGQGLVGEEVEVSSRFDRMTRGSFALSSFRTFGANSPCMAFRVRREDLPLSGRVDCQLRHPLALLAFVPFRIQ